jgi:predicted transcriptional regulator
MDYGESLRNRIFFIIRENPGIVRTEVRDMLKMQNNIVGPCIKQLIDMEMVMEGTPRLSKTTNKPGKQLYITDDWAKEVDAQNRIFN